VVTLVQEWESDQKEPAGGEDDPEVAGDVEMLQDMVVAACNEAVKKVEEAVQEKTRGMLGGMGLLPACSEAMPDFAEPCGLIAGV